MRSEHADAGDPVRRAATRRPARACRTGSRRRGRRSGRRPTPTTSRSPPMTAGRTPSPSHRRSPERAAAPCRRWRWPHGTPLARSSGSRSWDDRCMALRRCPLDIALRASRLRLRRWSEWLGRWRSCSGCSSRSGCCARRSAPSCCRGRRSCRSPGRCSPACARSSTCFARDKRTLRRARPRHGALRSDGSHAARRLVGAVRDPGVHARVLGAGRRPAPPGVRDERVVVHDARVRAAARPPDRRRRRRRGGRSGSASSPC